MPEIRLPNHQEAKKVHEIRIDDNKIRIEMSKEEIIFSLFFDLSFVKYFQRFKLDEFRKIYKITEEKDLKEIFNDLINYNYEIDEKGKKIIFEEKN